MLQIPCKYPYMTKNQIDFFLKDSMKHLLSALTGFCSSAFAIPWDFVIGSKRFSFSSCLRFPTLWPWNVVATRPGRGRVDLFSNWYKMNVNRASMGIYCHLTKLVNTVYCHHLPIYFPQFKWDFDLHKVLLCTWLGTFQVLKVGWYSILHTWFRDLAIWFWFKCLFGTRLLLI